MYIPQTRLAIFGIKNTIIYDEMKCTLPLRRTDWHNLLNDGSPGFLNYLCNRHPRYALDESAGDIICKDCHVGLVSDTPAFVFQEMECLTISIDMPQC